MFTAAEMERNLTQPLEHWLPDAVRARYTGALSMSNLPTQTCNELLLELDWKQIWESVQSKVKEVLHSSTTINRQTYTSDMFRLGG